MSLNQTLPEKTVEVTGYLSKFPIYRTCLLELRAINNGIRHDLINLISNANEMCVTDMFVKLRLEQSVVSQHLAALKNLGIVASRREGKNIYYSLVYKNIESLLFFINDITASNGAGINNKSIDFGEVNYAFEILRVLSHELRLTIIDSILNHDNNINVNSIYSKLKIEQSITSQHLKMIRDVKLCSTHKQGKNIYYRMDNIKLDFIDNKILQRY